MMKTLTAVLGRFTKFDATVSYNALRLPLVGAAEYYVPYETMLFSNAPLFPVTARRRGPHGGNNGESDKGDDSEMRAVPGVDGFEPSRL